jgi:hypothetical protein
MLHRVSNTYRDLASLVPGLLGRPSNSDRNKQLLLEMAGKGEPRPKRPKKYNRGLRHEYAFFRYTRKGDKDYDPVFTKKVKEIAPDWLMSQSEITEQKKLQLLQMASCGKQKPTLKKHGSLADILFRHTTPGEFGYDPDFAKKINKLAPHWFAEPDDEQKKQELLNMAKEGKHKPTYNKMARSLAEFIDKNSKAHDPAFSKKIKKLAPKWFAKEICEEKKQMLIEIARKAPKEEPRPNQRTHPLGLALHTYIQKTSNAYDPAFVEKIKKIAPHWLLSNSDRAEQNKKALLEMARKGKPRPKHLDSRIYTYMHVDSVFASKIRKLAPHWFLLWHSADRKKKELLELARNGLPRPNRKSELGRVLCNYVRTKSSSYDPDFAKKINKLAPHWFRKAAL